MPIESEGGKSALAVMHQLLLDPSLSSAQIRRRFFDVAAGSGMDAKVLSFALLSRKDVVVLDRIQGRHLWDDGTFEGKNIYDGIPKQTASGNIKGEGLVGILAGPRAVAIYEMIEEGMADTVQQAYKILGREGDASLARFHWESWVIDGNQAVDHGSLRAVYDPNLPGAGRVQEGKPNTFAHGAVYMRVGDDTVVLYQTSDGQSFQFSPQDFDKFTKSISKKSKSNDIIPKDFKVTVDANGNPRTEAWFNDPEVNRNALDDAVRKFGREWDGPDVSSTRGFVETDTTNIGRQSWQQYADQRGAAQ